MAKRYRCDDCKRLTANRPEESVEEDGSISTLTLCDQCPTWEPDRDYQIGYAYACGYHD